MKIIVKGEYRLPDKIKFESGLILNPFGTELTIPEGEDITKAQFYWDLLEENYRGEMEHAGYSIEAWEKAQQFFEVSEE